MGKKKYKLYMHTGSGNHGCEAIVRTIASFIGNNVELYSKTIQEDKKYLKEFKISFRETGNIPALATWDGFITRIMIKVFKRPYAFVKIAYKDLLKSVDKDTISLSIGGDNYCYDGMPEVLAILNRALNRNGGKTVLYGCSIEPELLKNNLVLEDLNRYALIVPRESITYHALIEAGLKEKTVLASDPAFTLPTIISDDVLKVIGDNTVGINISPLVLEGNNTILFDAYCRLIEWIISDTDMSIALIPHVVWDGNDDRVPLKELYEKYSWSKRIVLIEDHNASELKGYISKCRFFVGARTHATIAAYSSCIPTLVAGYSVKSKGIARDIFGTEEHYVIDIKNIKSEDMLLKEFLWIYKEENNIRSYLVRKMPEYIQEAYNAVEILKKI